MISFTREHYYFLVVRHVGTSMAQHARHTSRHVTTRTTRRACRVVTQQVVFRLYRIMSL